MYVATTANSRVTFYAARYSDPDTAYKKAFCIAFEGGCVMGFCLVSLALFVLTAIIYFYKGKLKIFKKIKNLYIFLFVFVNLSQNFGTGQIK